MSGLLVLLLGACSATGGNLTRFAPPEDGLPVARFFSRAYPDDIAACVAERWQRLSTLGVGEVRRHPGFRGLVVDVRAPGDPLARARVEIFTQRGLSRIDYYIRSFTHDPVEDLRLRALQLCLQG